MKNINHYRNPLDILLTDILPEETPINFSYKSFYNYLCTKDKEIKDIKKSIHTSVKKVFAPTSWASIPLHLQILKNTNDIRTLSLLQPLASLNILFYLLTFEDAVLNHLKNHNLFSIRVHQKMNTLFFQKKINKKILYRNPESQWSYFHIGPISAYHKKFSLKEWEKNNLEYKYYSELDYQACFENIYTHTIKHLCVRNPSNSKDLSNKFNYFSCLDRILQNINNHISNGIVVGPEFSRLVAELVLQHIDQLVFYQLLNQDIVYKRDYVIYRYVDDLSIFTHEKHIQDKIHLTYKRMAENLHLRINEAKSFSVSTPYFPSIQNTQLQNLTKHLTDITKSLLNNGNCIIPMHLKTDLCQLLTSKENQKTYAHYLISVVFNIINTHARSRQNKTIQNKTTPTLSQKHAKKFIDLLLFIYFSYPSNNNTKKIISTIQYLYQNFQLKSSVIQGLIRQYETIFLSEFIYDFAEWLPYLGAINVHFTLKVEKYLKEKITQSNDPLLMALFLQYTHQYSVSSNNILWKETLENIELHLQKFKTSSTIFTLISPKSHIFWFLIIFFNCPYISMDTQKILYDYLSFQRKKREQKEQREQQKAVSAQKLILTFMKDAFDSNGQTIKNSQNMFFNWHDMQHFAQKLFSVTSNKCFFLQKKHKKYLIKGSIGQ